MNKVELAKMLGLELTGYNSVCKWEIKELLEHDWQSISWQFNAGITEIVEQHDLSKNNLDITYEDLVREEDIKVCIKQVEGLLWQRAAETYLRKIKGLVETIRV